MNLNQPDTILVPDCLWRGCDPSPAMRRVYLLFNIDPFVRPANDNRLSPVRSV